MSPKPNLGRLERGVRALAPPAPDPAADLDPDQLAREVARAFADELAQYRRLQPTEPERLNPADPPADWELTAVRTKPPDQVTFADLERLARTDPAEATARWEEVKAGARRDLDRGWAAARAVEYLGGSAWERACFLAVRDRLRRAWRPRNDGEAMLLDEMAQYELVRQWWVGVLSLRSRDPATITRRRPQGDRGDDRRQSAAEATAEAGRMVERLQRLYQNAVRLLLSLRRGKATVVYQRTGQVNVGVGQQMNVGTPAEPEARSEGDAGGVVRCPEQPFDTDDADDADPHGSEQIRSVLIDPRESASNGC
jgi:hypothetical protein